MRAIIVDDEPLMLRYFSRLAKNLPDLELIGQFHSGIEALDYVKNNGTDVAFLDVMMPGMNGIELAVRLKKIRKDMLIVIVSGKEEYLRDSNRIGCDYYLMKPYDLNMLEIMMDKLRFLAKVQQKRVYIKTIGSFGVFRDGERVQITGKAEEILALIIAARGKEVSNQTIYTIIWDGRPYGNKEMQTYYNALKRLKTTLDKEKLSQILISTPRGHMANVDIIDCDYYSWLDKSVENREDIGNNFLPAYTWSDEVISSLVGDYFT